MPTPTCVALVPARAGSKRVPGKNIRPLAGHPLLAYTIAAARDSGVFTSIVVSTDAEETAAIARYYGAEVPFLRPAEMAGDLSPDIEWVTHMLGRLEMAGQGTDCFSLLRPTSPFRYADTIKRAWQCFQSAGPADSLRAVELCRQHPGKMWVVDGERIRPLLRGDEGVPWHSRPYQALPQVYVQNASLEIAWTRTVRDTGTIAGHAVVPFFTQDYEGFDVNEPKDWWYAEHLVATGGATLPPVTSAPWAATAAGAV
ncbi:MAG TPA: acylneuraminate cytidylyltransferase family protein [Gemmatimonadales bacterium]